MKLHEKVAALRKLKNKTQKQMADFIGIGVTAYSNKETGKRKFTIEELEKIASFLGEKITIFFDDKIHITWNNHDSNQSTA